MTVRATVTTAIGVAAMSCLLAACGSAGSTAGAPHPHVTVPTTAPAPQLAVSPHAKPARCPSHPTYPGSNGVVPTSSQPSTRPFVPAGPKWVTVCRYAGLNQRVPSGTLERSKVVTGKALAELVSLADQAAEVPSNVSFNCPMSEGLIDMLLFVYPSGKTAAVSVDVDGCVWAHSGHRTVWAGPIASLLKGWVGQDGL